MFKSYFKIAWRTLLANKFYSIINVLGLAMGICACLVIYLLASYELSFDRFHPDKERIYRINTYMRINTDMERLMPVVAGALPDAIQKEIPGVETVAGYHLYDATITIPEEDKGSVLVRHFDSKIAGTGLPSTIITTPQYFAIFKYDWLAGNAGTALEQPFSVVVSESKARKYFGAGPFDQMIGRKIVYNDSLQVFVSGIVRDWKENTDFPFTDFISLATAEHNFLYKDLELGQWGFPPYSSRVLVKLAKGASPARVNRTLLDLFKENGGGKLLTKVTLQPLTGIHFTDDVGETDIRTAHLPTLYALISTALFILILAIINYVNLMTAQSIERMKETGIRKVLGSSRINLVFQFLAETFVLTGVAVCVALLGVRPMLAAFHQFIPPQVDFHPFQPGTLFFLALLTGGTTLLAGLYPAKVLSSQMPVLSLKGAGAPKGSEKWWLRKGLIVFQFTVSLVFIIGTLVIGEQIRFMLHADLGFKSDAVVFFDTNGADSLRKVKLLAQKIGEVTGVGGVALQNIEPMGSNLSIVSLHTKESKERMVVSIISADERYIPLYGMRVLAGRNLLPGDTLKEFVINETFARALGYSKPGQALGKTLFMGNEHYPIAGVVADFHQFSFHEPIKPLVIVNGSTTGIAIRLEMKDKQVSDAKAILTRVEKQWKEVYPHDPFEYKFMDESIRLLYQKEETTAWLMNIATGITIFISCMGLFGLALFNARQRSREIGIRKVLGASVTSIVSLLSTDFLKLVLLATAIASPVAWYFIHRWLQDFAYRIDIGAWVFVLAGLAAMVIALITVSFQAIKAAIANPIGVLGSE